MDPWKIEDTELLNPLILEYYHIFKERPHVFEEIPYDIIDENKYAEVLRWCIEYKKPIYYYPDWDIRSFPDEVY